MGNQTVVPAQSGFVRLRLIIAYDGTAYQGWQTQKIGQGIQPLVESALRHLFPGAGALHSSSRTDTGVHAVGMAAHVDLPAQEWRMSTRKLVLAVNAHLPEDIRVFRATRARPDFHARFHATGKEYRYRIWNAPAAHPLLTRLAWHVPRPLALLRMRQAAGELVGTHDFAALSANPGYARASTVRTLTRCQVQARGHEVTVIIRGDGFLYKMCRGLVGTLVAVGLGRLEPHEIRPLLAQRERRHAGMTAPAQGLVLWRVFYDGTRPVAAGPPGEDE